MWACVLFAALAGRILAGRRRAAATTEQIVVDRNTGLAIYGFDPVSYFTDGKAAGRPCRARTSNHGGVAWRFRNEGNRAAFADDPDVYMPRYGGHDPVAIGRGIARPGHPDFWAIHDKKLFLFYSEDAKMEFERRSGGTALQAEANWPHVRETLAP